MKNNRRLFFFTLMAFLQHAHAETVSLQRIAKITIEKEHQRPLIAANVAGHDAVVLLDTTCSHPTFLEAFAREKGIYTANGPLAPETVVPLASQTIPFHVGGVDTTLGQTVVIKNIRNNDRQYIDMVFNPHAFACPHCIIVLDFINQELYTMQGASDEAAQSAVDKRYRHLLHAAAPYAGNQDGTLYVSDVGVNQEKAGVALVDIAMNYSLFLRSSVKNNIPIARKSHIKVKGKDTVTEITAAVPIAVGGKVIARLPIMLETASSFANHFLTHNDPEYIPYQGSIGMDILKNCALAINVRQAVHFYCTPPA